MKYFELVELLADGGEGDWLANNFLDRQCRATASIAVELGQDHTVELERFVERLSCCDRVLAGHRVDDKEGVIGADSV